jgi:amino acid transporter
MARDGLLPSWAAKVHPRYRTPHVTTLLTGLIVALCSSVANINELVDLTNIGTLFAFALVAAGIIVLRRIDPDRPRPFRTPLVPWVPLLALRLPHVGIARNNLVALLPVDVRRPGALYRLRSPTQPLAKGNREARTPLRTSGWE